MRKHLNNLRNNLIQKGVFTPEIPETDDPNVLFNLAKGYEDLTKFLEDDNVFGVLRERFYQEFREEREELLNTPVDIFGGTEDEGEVEDVWVQEEKEIDTNYKEKTDKDSTRETFETETEEEEEINLFEEDSSFDLNDNPISIDFSAFQVKKVAPIEVPDTPIGVLDLDKEKENSSDFGGFTSTPTSRFMENTETSDESSDNLFSTFSPKPREVGNERRKPTPRVLKPNAEEIFFGEKVTDESLQGESFSNESFENGEEIGTLKQQGSVQTQKVNIKSESEKTLETLNKVFSLFRKGR